MSTLKRMMAFWLCMVCCLSIGATQVERKQLFNDDWKFWLGDEATASTVGFDDAAFLSSDEENTKVAYEPQKHKNIRGREYYLKKLQHTNITSYKACQERAIALTIL